MLLKFNASKTVANIKSETPHMAVGRGIDLAGAETHHSSSTPRATLSRVGTPDGNRTTSPLDSEGGQPSSPLAHARLQRRSSKAMLASLLAEEVGAATATGADNTSVVGVGVEKKSLSAVAKRILRCAKLLRPFADAWTCKICFEGACVVRAWETHNLIYHLCVYSLHLFAAQMALNIFVYGLICIRSLSLTTTAAAAAAVPMFMRRTHRHRNLALRTFSGVQGLVQLKLT